MKGEGVAKDYQKAFGFLKAGADRGEPAAQSTLGVMYMNGYGVGRDYAQALKWTKSAALTGLGEAAQNLGYLYDMGLGIVRDHQEAKRWYCVAAEQGVPAAQNTVAYYLAAADGAHDYGKAAEWYAKAAAQGLPAAQLNLGILYTRGLGVPLDYIEAFAWLSAAKAGGSKDAVKELNSLRRIMTSQQIKVAEMRVAAGDVTLIKSEKQASLSPQDHCPLISTTTARR
jgi:TPR repeat protein